MPRRTLVHPIIQLRVDKCHVAESYLSVIRYVLRTANPAQYARFRLAPRRKRRRFIREILYAHKKNRELYAFVMKGR